MQSSKPIIGMTGIIQMDGLSIVTLEQNFCTSNFLQQILPADSLEIQSAIANCFHLIYRKQYQVKGLRSPLKYDLAMETDLIIDKRPGDHGAPLIWDFYCSQNSHLFAFSGRIRIRPLDSPLKRIKIGIYIYELSVRDEELSKIGEKVMKALIRQDIRSVFIKMEKFRLNPLIT